MARKGCRGNVLKEFGYESKVYIGKHTHKKKWCKTEVGLVGWLDFPC